MNDSKAKLMTVVFVILLTSAYSFAVEKSNKLTRGQQDDVTLLTMTKVGDLTLLPGHYILQDKLSHGKHMMSFDSFVPYGSQPGHGRTYYPPKLALPWSPMGRSRMGETECAIRRLDLKVKRAQVVFVDERGTQRITRIEIRGENVAHLFSAAGE